MVNGIAEGRFEVERGNRRPLDGLERPVIPGISLRLLVQRGGQSRGNPFAQGSDFRGLQGLALRRHTLLKILAGDACKQLTLSRLVGRYHRARLGSLADGRSGIKPQPSLLLQPAMTGVTPRLQHRLDVTQIIGGLGRAYGGQTEEDNDSRVSHVPLKGLPVLPSMAVGGRKGQASRGSISEARWA